MLASGLPNTWGFMVTNEDAPSITFGTSVTPGASNAYGSWTQLLAGAAITEDCYGIQIAVMDVGTNSAARDCLVDIGADPAGGSSYSVLIPTLMASCAQAITGFGITYYFPLLIKAGTSIAARAKVNNATAGTSTVAVMLVGKPSAPDQLSYGTYVDAYGANGAASAGASVTPGTSGVEGSWVSLGGINRPAWWWQAGFGINNSSMSGQNYLADLAVGDATDKVLLVKNSAWNSTALENLQHPVDFLISPRLVGSFSGNLYVRASCSGTPVSGCSMMAYGLG